MTRGIGCILCEHDPFHRVVGFYRRLRRAKLDTRDVTVRHLECRLAANTVSQGD